MKTIVAPVDFSDIAVNAAEYAADLAAALHGELRLIHICPIPVSYGEVPGPVFNMTEMIQEAEKLVSQLTVRLSRRTNDQVKIFTEVREGAVLTGIEDYCADVKPYAVVMGAETAGAFERFLFGAKTISAIRQLSWPLVIVPPAARFASIRRVGLACDFRKVAETVPVREIENLVNQFHAELHVLHVSGDDPHSFTDRTINEAAWLQAMLGNLHPKYDFIKGNDIEKGIVDFAERNCLDLLIVIPKKHSLMRKVFQYSHSRRIVLHTQLPLLSLHE